MTSSTVNLDQQRICVVAGHAWIAQSDSWGTWKRCQRCGTLGPATKYRATFGGRPVEYNLVTDTSTDAFSGVPSRSGVVLCNRWVYQDEVGPGKPRCVLPAGHAARCSEIPLK